MGIPDREYSHIRLYPNPAGDHLIVLWENPALATPPSIRLIDLAGREMPVQHTITATGSIRLNMAAFTPGIYLLQLRSGEYLFTAKLVKQ